jgi:hypothetical protein
MSDTVEAIQGAFTLVVGGFILLVFGQALAGTALDNGALELGLVGILAVLGGVIILVTAIAVLVGKLLT